MKDYFSPESASVIVNNMMEFAVSSLFLRDARDLSLYPERVVAMVDLFEERLCRSIVCIRTAKGGPLRH